MNVIIALNANLIGFYLGFGPVVFHLGHSFGFDLLYIR